MARAGLVRHAGEVCSVEGTASRGNPYGGGLSIGQRWTRGLFTIATGAFIAGSLMQLATEAGILAPPMVNANLVHTLQWLAPCAALLSLALLFSSEQPSTGEPETNYSNIFPAPEQSHGSLAEGAILKSELCALKEKRLALEKQSQRLAQIADQSLRAEALTKQRSALQASLLASVSHELRTPLNAVIGFADVMDHQLHGPIGNDKYREYVSHIGESGRLLLKTIDDMFALNGFGDGDQNPAEHFDLARLLKDCAQTLSQGAGDPSITITTKSNSSVEVVAEIHALRQAIIGLMLAMSRRLAADGQIDITLITGDSTARLTFIGRQAERIGPAWKALEQQTQQVGTNTDVAADLGLVTALLARSLLNLSNRELVLSHDERSRELKATLEIPLAATQSASATPIKAVA